MTPATTPFIALLALALAASSGPVAAAPPTVMAVCLSSARPMAMLRVGSGDYLVEPGWHSPDGRLTVEDLTRDGLLLRSDGVARLLPVGPPLPLVTAGAGSPAADGSGSGSGSGSADSSGSPAATSHPDRITLLAAGVDVGDLMQMLSRSTGLTVVLGPTVTGATTIQATERPAADVVALVAATHDVRVSTSPDIPGAVVLSRYGLDDVVFDPVADPAARRTTVKMRPSRVSDVLRLLAVSAGVKLRFAGPVDGIMAVEMTDTRPLDALRLVAAAAGLDVRRTDEAGVFDVTPAPPPR